MPALTVIVHINNHRGFTQRTACQVWRDCITGDTAKIINRIAQIMFSTVLGFLSYNLQPCLNNLETEGVIDNEQPGRQNTRPVLRA